MKGSGGASAGQAGRRRVRLGVGGPAISGCGRGPPSRRPGSACRGSRRCRAAVGHDRRPEAGPRRTCCAARSSIAPRPASGSTARRSGCRPRTARSARCSLRSSPSCGDAGGSRGTRPPSAAGRSRTTARRPPRRGSTPPTSARPAGAPGPLPSSRGPDRTSASTGRNRPGQEIRNGSGWRCRQPAGNSSPDSGPGHAAASARRCPGLWPGPRGRSVAGSRYRFPPPRPAPEPRTAARLCPQALCTGRPGSRGARRRSPPRPDRTGTWRALREVVCQRTLRYRRPSDLGVFTLSAAILRMIRPCEPIGLRYSVPLYLRDSSSMCSRASSPVVVLTTWPRTSDQSYGLSAEWISTVIRGSLLTFLARWRVGSVFTRTCSPSVSTQVSRACGWPFGISVTTVARFLPLARRTVSSSSGTICLPYSGSGIQAPAGSVTVGRDVQLAGDGVEAQVGAGHGGGDVGVDAEVIGVQRVHGEDVPVRRVTLGRRGATEVLGAVVVPHRERSLGQSRTIRTASAPGKLGHRCRDAEHHPVPESGPGRRIGVVGGHCEPLGLRREPGPAQVRRYVVAGHAEAVVHLCVAHLLAVTDVVTFDREGRDLGVEVIGQRCAFGHGVSLVLDGRFALLTLSTGPPLSAPHPVKTRLPKGFPSCSRGVTFGDGRAGPS